MISESSMGAADDVCGRVCCGGTERWAGLLKDMLQPWKEWKRKRRTCFTEDELHHSTMTPANFQISEPNRPFPSIANQELVFKNHKVCCSFSSSKKSTGTSSAGPERIATAPLREPQAAAPVANPIVPMLQSGFEPTVGQLKQVFKPP
jgi:hypothetical protein